MQLLSSSSFVELVGILMFLLVVGICVYNDKGYKCISISFFAIVVVTVVILVTSLSSNAKDVDKNSESSIKTVSITFDEGGYKKLKNTVSGEINWASSTTGIKVDDYDVYYADMSSSDEITDITEYGIIKSGGDANEIHFEVLEDSISTEVCTVPYEWKDGSSYKDSALVLYIDMNSVDSVDDCVSYIKAYLKSK